MRECCIRDGAGTRSNTGKDHKSSLPVAEASEMSGYTPAGIAAQSLISGHTWPPNLRIGVVWSALIFF
jgi:hypothetical protein